MLAVKLWKDRTDKPEGMPGLWPAEVIENIGSCTEPWILMSKPEYQAYKLEHEASYNAYLNTIPVPTIGEE